MPSAFEFRKQLTLRLEVGVLLPDPPYYVWRSMTTTTTACGVRPEAPRALLHEQFVLPLLHFMRDSLFGGEKAWVSPEIQVRWATASDRANATFNAASVEFEPVVWHSLAWPVPLDPLDETKLITPEQEQFWEEVERRSLQPRFPTPWGDE